MSELQEKVARALVVCAATKELAVEPIPDDIAYELAQAAIDVICEALLSDEVVEICMLQMRGYSVNCPDDFIEVKKALAVAVQNLRGE